MLLLCMYVCVYVCVVVVVVVVVLGGGGYCFLIAVVVCFL